VSNDDTPLLRQHRRIDALRHRDAEKSFNGSRCSQCFGVPLSTQVPIGVSGGVLSRLRGLTPVAPDGGWCDPEPPLVNAIRWADRIERNFEDHEFCAQGT
jgi:hypothetical protein